MMNRDRPVWLITGCSTGFGRELARLVLARGWRAVVTARDASKVADLVAGHDDQAIAVALDVTDRAHIDVAVAAAIARFGRIDVLVNIAGFGYLGAVEEGEDDAVRALFDTNVFGLIDMTKAVLPAMRAQGHCRIIHVASQMGSVAAEENALYGLTKAALIHLTRNMAFELAKEGIQVNSVSPGPIATQFNLDTWGRMPGKLETMVGRVPAGRMGEAREVAEAIVFLATAEGSYIQGHDLVVDGGWTAI